MSACICTLMPGINYLDLFGTRSLRLCKYLRQNSTSTKKSLGSWKFRPCSLRLAVGLLKSLAAFPRIASVLWLSAAHGLILKRIRSLF